MVMVVVILMMMTSWPEICESTETSAPFPHSVRTEQMNSKWLSGKGRCAGLGGDGGDDNGDGCGDFDDDDKLAKTSAPRPVSGQSR